MKYKDLKKNDIYYADWHGLLVYILNIQDDNCEILMFDESKNTINIYRRTKEDWNNSMFISRDPVSIYNRKYRLRFIRHIFNTVKENKL